MRQEDISVEAWREYVFATGPVYRIDNPKTLYLKDGGTAHRVMDANGVAHYVPAGWRVLRWYGPVVF